MPDPRHELGRRAEAATAAWLVTRGWQVLAHRWRSGAGELDLVCLDTDGTLVAVEVKLRSTTRAGSAGDAVNPRRVARLRGALLDYARTASVPRGGLRIDLVAVTPAEAGWRLVRFPAIDAW